MMLNLEAEVQKTDIVQGTFPPSLWAADALIGIHVAQEARVEGGEDKKMAPVCSLADQL